MIKRSNDYARALGDLLERAPKTVIAAIAYSLARIDAEDDHDGAIAVLVREWRILHEQGIVPQAPPASYTSNPTAVPR